MRNAVIRKKRLKAERMVDDFLRMPQRLIVPAFNFSGNNDMTPQEIATVASRQRLWAL